LRTILDSIADAVVTTDGAGRIVRVNPAGGILSGLPATALIGRPFDEVFTLADEVTGKVISSRPSAFADGTPVPLPAAVLRRVDGTVRPVAGGWAPIRGPEGSIQGAVLSLRDATEPRRLEELLRHSQKMDAIGQLAGGVAHDFNNLLTGILGYAELLASHLKSQPDLQLMARKIGDISGRAGGLTRQLLTFSRHGRTVNRAIDLHLLIEETVAMLRRTIDPRVQISTNLRASRHAVVGDPALLENALLNLGINARDAMPDGGSLAIATNDQIVISDEPAATAFALASGDYIEITVTDTGSGMDRATSDRLFTPFFTTKAPGKGTGLGLAMVYGTVKEHRGAVTVESHVGVGTKFRLWLPACDQITAERRAGSGLQTAIRGHGGVLVVDDEPEVRAIAV
jgi:two-component system, cell cycle sensor histidine kinase and response regulator CckA